MDPNLQNVLLGVVANALTSVLAQAGRGLLSAGDDASLVERVAAQRNSISALQHQAACALAEQLDWSGPPSLEETCLFLASPEAESVVRQVLSTRLLSQDAPSKHLDLIQREFTHSFALFAGVPEPSLQPQGSLLLDQLIRATDAALEHAISLGLLSAHEAKSAFRHHAIIDELNGIKRTLSFLTAATRPDVRDILRFEVQYRAQVGTRHAFIMPPNFDAARKVPIDDLYEPSDFLRLGRTKDDERLPLGLPIVLQSIHRAVILGTPGGGKSTLLAKLCHDLATRYSDRFLAGRQLTPVLVVLRDYGADKKAHGRSLLQFIEHVATSKYQVPAPTGAFEYLLLNGRVAVFFDGLDELLETNYRQEISSDVESFGNMYPAVPILVTSREVGYEQAPLDERRYQAFRLAPFEHQQVARYASKWFGCDPDLTAEQQTRKARAFVQESAIVSDLRSNPLMLALMCNIYRGENYIPRNRPDVYQKCAVMLFERWDKSRGIEVPLPFEAHISPAMKYLAHWIYSDEALQSGVTEEQLVNKAGEYLCAWRFEDSEEGKVAARSFIDFCRGRAWVFTDTGTRKEGERLYQFTHRTFLEYFTADHLVRTQSTPQALLGSLRQRIERREWDVVAQLAFQLLNRHVEGAGDALIGGLLKGCARATTVRAQNRLSFASRCLEFMVPRPALTRDIVGTVVRHCLRDQGADPGRPLVGVRHDGNSAEQLLGEVLSAAAENRPVIAGTLESMVLERAGSKDEEAALRALDMGLHLSFSLFSRPLSPAAGVPEYWASISQRIFDQVAPRVEALGEKHFVAAYDAVHFGSMRLAEFGRLHGVRSFFRVRPLRIARSMLLSVADNVFESALRGPSLLAPSRIGFRQRPQAALAEIGNSLVGSRVPWLGARRRDQLPWVHYLLRRLPRAMTEIDGPLGGPLEPDALFGAFAVFAPAFEALDVGGMLRGEHGRALLEWLQQLPPDSSLKRIGTACLSRLGSITAADLHVEFRAVGLTADKLAFIERWAGRQFDLVAQGRHSRVPERLVPPVALGSR